MKRTGISLCFLLALTGCSETVTDIFRYGHVEVHAARRSGEPVPGVELTLYSDIQIVDEALTDAQGYHSFEFVAPRVYGVRGEPPTGYARPEDVVGGPSSAFVDAIRIREETRKSVDLTYVKVGGSGRVEVRVAEPDGSPVEGAEVHLYGPEGELDEAVVGSSGVVVFDPVSFGNRGVRVVPDRKYLDFNEAEFDQDRLLVEEGWTEVVDFSLEECRGTIRGIVVDTEGNPVPDFPLRLYLPQSDYALKETEANGKKSFHDLPCKEFGLALVPTLGWRWGEERREAYFDGIKVRRGRTKDRVFTVERCMAPVRVQVVDEAGFPLSGVTVELFSSKGPVEQALTGESGEWTFLDVPCGQEYGVRAWPLPGYVLEEGRGSSFFDGIDPSREGEIVRTFVLRSG